MTKTAPSRSFGSHVAFFVVFAMLCLGGVVLVFFAEPLFALTPLQWGFALVVTVSVGLFAAWELRCLLRAQRAARRRRAHVG